MKKMFFIFLTILMSQSLLTQAASTAECVPQSEIADIASHFTQFKNIANNQFCFDGSPTSNLIATLVSMRKTAFAADMKKSKDELFSGRFAANWYKYFIERITDLDVQDNCPKGVGAYVYGWGTTMYVCPLMLTESFSAIDRASVFMHEARHIDGYPHITCSKGPRRGLRGACDTRISDGGSYAVTVETYAQLGKYATDLHPALKTYAMASAVVYADEAFETPARINRQETLLLMSKSKDLYNLDPESAYRTTALGQTPALGHIVHRAQHAVLFPDDKNLTARYLFAKNEGEITQSAGEAVSEYNSQTPEQRSQLVDLHVATQWVAKVYRDKIRFSCDPNSGSTNDVTVNGALGIVYMTGYNRQAASAQLITKDGTVMEFGCTNLKGFVRSSDGKLDSKIMRVHKVNGHLIGLSNDGYLFEIAGSQLTPIATPIDGQIHEIALRHNYQFTDEN